MTKKLLSNVRLPQYLLFLFFIICVTAAIFYAAKKVPEEAWLAPIVYGLASGLVVYLLSFMTGVYSLRKIDEYEQMGVLAVLPNRHEKEYYKKYLAGAKTEVLVIGASATRFLKDFMDPKSEDKVLFNVLQNNSGATLKILVPTDAYMTDKSKARWNEQSDLRVSLSEKLKGQIEFVRFNEPPHQSFVVVDDQIITGPIFPNVDSEYSPALHIKRHNKYAEKHIEYFKRLWNEYS